IVEQAYAFARKAHAGQKRYSGEEYFSHPVSVARHLTQMQLDPITVAAGLLHDVPEDTDITLDQITEHFGQEIAFLVDGVTKLSKVRMTQQQIDQSNQVDQTNKAAVDREQAATE